MKPARLYVLLSLLVANLGACGGGGSAGKSSAGTGGTSSGGTTGAGGTAGGGTSSGGTSGGGGGSAGTGGVAPDGGVEAGAVTSQAAFALPAGGVFAKSQNFSAVLTLGEAPGGNTVMKSTTKTMKAGLPGKTQ